MSEPVAKAMLLCNYVMEDIQRRRSLIACFDSVRQNLPGLLPGFFVFLRLADVPMRTTEMLQVEDPNGITVWSSGPKPYEQNPEAPKKYLESLFQVPPILVVLPGRYRIVYLMGAERVGDTELNVEKSQEAVRA